MQAIKAKPLIHLIEGERGQFKLDMRMLEGFGFDGVERDVYDAADELVAEADRRGLALMVRDHPGTDHYDVAWVTKR